MISVGTDIVAVQRVAQVWHRFQNAFVKKILSFDEQKHFLKISDENSKLRFLAGRFCGKEAVFKASQEPLTWKMVSLLPTDESPAKPLVFVNQKVRDDLSLSISHEQDFAISVAIKCRQ